jgi:formamidopyrimidine-DNA glycosylase
MGLVAHAPSDRVKSCSSQYEFKTMPELPEVETVCRGLSALITGATIKDVTLYRKDLRIPFPKDLSKKLAGRTIKNISRRAKYLLFTLDDESVILAHLGMSGNFSVEKCTPKQLKKHDHLILTLTDKRVVIYNDPRRFGLITWAAAKDIANHPLLAHLGPEPFSKDFSAKYLKAALLSRKAPIKPALMDQELVVGVGNIYASEALFLAGINPEKPAHLAAKKADILVKVIQQVLGAAIESGGSSLRDFLQVSGETGYFQHTFQVYERAGEPCFSCHSPIQATRQAGRSTFYCKRCQS